MPESQQVPQSEIKSETPEVKTPAASQEKPGFLKTLINKAREIGNRLGGKKELQAIAEGSASNNNEPPIPDPIGIPKPDVVGQLASTASETIPVVGTAKPLVEAALGKDIITGEEVSPYSRVVDAALNTIPVVGPARKLKKGLEVAADINRAVKIADKTEDILRPTNDHEASTTLPVEAPPPPVSSEMKPQDSTVPPSEQKAPILRNTPEEDQLTSLKKNSEPKQIPESSTRQTIIEESQRINRERQTKAKNELKYKMEDWPRPDIGPNMESFHDQLQTLTLNGDREYFFSIGRQRNGSTISLTGLGEGLQIEVPGEFRRSQFELKRLAAERLDCEEIIDVHTHPHEKILTLADPEHDALFTEQVRRETSGELPPFPHPPSGADIHGSFTKYTEQLMKDKNKLDDIRETKDMVADATGVWEVDIEKDSPMHDILSLVADRAWEESEADKAYHIGLAKEGIDQLSSGQKIKKGATDSELESWWVNTGRIVNAKQKAANIFSEANWKNFLAQNKDSLGDGVNLETLFENGTLGDPKDYSYAYSKEAMQKLISGDPSIQQEEYARQLDNLDKDMQWKRSVGIKISHSPYKKEG